MPPLRVVYVSHSIPPADAPEASIGGMQRVAVDLLAALRRRPDVDLDAWTLSVPWSEIGRRTTGFILRVAGGLPRRARDADAVLFSSLVTGGIAPGVRFRLRRPALVSIAHGQDVTLPNPLHQAWLRPTFRALDAVLAVSSATAEACVARGLAPEKALVAHNGIDPESVSPPADRAAARAALRDRLGLSPESVLLLVVGRQVERKGTAWFVGDVLPRLPPHAHLVVVGAGPETERISSVAFAAGVEPRVHLLGRAAPDVLDAARHGADLFLMPNVPVPGDMEGFGVVLLEAALAGLYTVGTGIEGIRDAVVEPTTGRLVPPRSPAAFAAAILPFVEDPASAHAAGMRARALVQERFSWDGAADVYVRHLRTLVERRRERRR